MKKIPVIVLAGFLGSGKTTLLNHLLKHSLGMRLGVIVNDFGAVNVDALLVAKQSDEKVELSNGCICCTLGEGGIDETLAQLAYRETPIDAIIIEASGIAEPGEIAFLVQASKNPFVEFAGIAYVIDTENFKMMEADISRHVGMADLIVLNKTDVVDAEKLENVREKCADLNERAPIIATSRGRIDPQILFDMETPKTVQLSLAYTDEGHDDHLHDQYESVVFETEKPLDPAKVREFLAHPPRSVYRMKGFAYFGMKGYEQKFIVQLVGKRSEMYTEEWDGAPKTQLVCIGIGISQRELMAELEALIDETPDALSHDTMIDLQNYQKRE